MRFQFMNTHGSIMVSPPGNPRPCTSGIWKYASSDGDGDVGEQRPVGAAAERVAVHLGDGRLAELPEAQRRPEEEVGLRLPDRVPVLHVLGELGVRVAAAGGVPGAEPLAVGLDHHHLHRVVAVGEREGVVERVDHLRRLAVGPAGIVQHDVGDGAVDVVGEGAEVLVSASAQFPAGPARPPGDRSGSLTLRTLPGCAVAPAPLEQEGNLLCGREDPPDAGRQEEAADVPRGGGRRPQAPRRALHRDHRAVRPPPGPVVLPDRRRLGAGVAAQGRPAHRAGAEAPDRAGRVGPVRGRAQQARGHQALASRGYVTGKVAPGTKTAEGRARGAGRRPRLPAAEAPAAEAEAEDAPAEDTPPKRTRRAGRGHAGEKRHPNERRDERRHLRRRLRRRGRCRGQPHRRRRRRREPACARGHRVRHPQPRRRPRRDRGRRGGARAARSR